MRVKLSTDGLHAFGLIHAARPFPVPIDQLRGEVSMRARNSACYLVRWECLDGAGNHLIENEAHLVHPNFLEMLSPWPEEG